MSTKSKIGLGLIVASFIIVLCSFFFLKPIAQSLDYHQFSDSSAYVNLPNTLNVLSNIPFILVGALGLLALFNSRKYSLTILTDNTLSYVCLYAGALFVGFGSSYYHLNPNNETLVWDRLPMTIAFMGLYSIILSEFISVKVGKMLLIPFITLGIFSVL